MRLFSKIWKTGLVTERLQAETPGAVQIARELERQIRRRFGRALALALVDNIVPDFPLCNEPFNQSYSGNDL